MLTRHPCGTVSSGFVWDILRHRFTHIEHLAPA